MNYRYERRKTVFDVVSDVHSKVKTLSGTCLVIITDDNLISTETYCAFRFFTFHIICTIELTFSSE